MKTMSWFREASHKSNQDSGLYKESGEVKQWSTGEMEEWRIGDVGADLCVCPIEGACFKHALFITPLDFFRAVRVLMSLNGSL
jgi:hypothetical protein